MGALHVLEGCTPYPPELIARYRSLGYWGDQTIAQAIAEATAKFGGQRSDPIVVADPRRAIRYSELLREAGALAAMLEGCGLRPGDRIVVQLPNCVEFATLLIGCAEAGVIPVMALPAFRRAELEYLVRYSGAAATAIAPQHRDFDHAALACELKRSIPGLKLIFSTAPAAGCIQLDASATTSRTIGSRGADSVEVALFLLSGGTTGLPKLIPRTHADYLYNARAAAEVGGLNQDSRILLALPIEHNFALACPGLLGSLLVGATAVLAPSTRAADLCAVIEGQRITHFPCVPTLALALLDFPGRARFELGSLRVITVGGARLKAETAARLKAAMAGIKVQQVFGMAEGLLCYTRLDDPEEIAFQTQGRPLSVNDEIRIVGEDGFDVGTGEIGELWCRGPYTLRGYYKAPERNRDAFSSDGFYKTGDLVRRHPSGNLVVEGRIKDMINRGGEKISAEEVESHLLAHPAIANAAVVAMPDARLGERCCAYVAVHAGNHLSLQDLCGFLAGRELARFKWPERLEVIGQMPQTAVGKVDKAELRRDITLKLAGESG